MYIIVYSTGNCTAKTSVADYNNSGVLPIIIIIECVPEEKINLKICFKRKILPEEMPELITNSRCPMLYVMYNVL